MCEAEREVEILERDVAKLGDKITDLCDHIDDCDRGIIDLHELRVIAAEYRRVYA